jgi:flagellar basal-body rod protein FlgC
MSLSAAMNSAVSGMAAQQNRLATTANNVANALTPGYNRLDTRLTTGPAGGVSASVSPSSSPVFGDGSNVDLGEEMLSLTETEIAFKANAAVFETGADLWDVLNTIVKD